MMATYSCLRCELTFASMERPLAGLCGICRLELREVDNLRTDDHTYKTPSDAVHRERLKRALAEVTK